MHAGAELAAVISKDGQMSPDALAERRLVVSRRQLHGDKAELATLLKKCATKFAHLLPVNSIVTQAQSPQKASSQIVLGVPNAASMLGRSRKMIVEASFA